MSTYFDFPAVEVSEQFGPSVLSSVLEDLDAFLKRPAGRLLVHSVRRALAANREEIEDNSHNETETSLVNSRVLAGQSDVLKTLLEPGLGMTQIVSTALNVQREGGASDKRGQP